MPTRTDLFVDTAGWAVYLDDTGALNSAARSIINQATRQNRRLVTTDYVIVELVALLTARLKLPRPQVITAINAILTDPTVDVIHIDRATFSEAWQLLEARPDKEWSLVDASSFVLMRRHGMTEALTTDHHFAQAGFTRVPAQP